MYIVYSNISASKQNKNQAVGGATQKTDISKTEARKLMLSSGFKPNEVKHKHQVRKQLKQSRGSHTSDLSYEIIAQKVSFDKDYFATLFELTHAENTEVLGCGNVEGAVDVSEIVVLCDVCKRTYCDLKELTEHVLQHHRDRLTCRRCQQVFLQVAWLARHVCTVQLATEGEHRCLKAACSKCFNKKLYLELHEESHVKPFHCEDCHESFETCSMFYKHHCSGNSHQPYCTACGQIHRNKFHMEKHSLVCQKRTYKCYLCNRPLSSKLKQQQHFNFCAKRLELMRNGRVKCFSCEQCFQDALALQIHIYEHEYPHTCNDCCSRFLSPLSLILHACHPLHVYFCVDCNVQFHVSFLYTQHMQHHANSLNIEGGHKYKCKHCECTFWDKFLAAKHPCQVQTSDNKTETQVAIPRQRFSCHICGIEMKSKGNLLRHVIEVHGKERFKCHICQRAFRSKSAYCTHVSVTHSTQKNFLCSYCGATFKQRTSLRYHIRTMHEMLNTLRCTQCAHEFVTHSQLNAHLKRHNPKEKNHSCPECDQWFSNKQTLQMHILRSHKSSCPYRCGTCLKGYIRPSELQSHCENVHSPNFFECCICRNCFKSKSALKTHYQKKHSNNQFSWKFESPGNKRNVSGTNQNRIPCKCGFCDNNFQDLVELKCHLQEFHYLEMQQWLACTFDLSLPKTANKDSNVTEQINVTGEDEIVRKPQECTITKIQVQKDMLPAVALNMCDRDQMVCSSQPEMRAVNTSINLSSAELITHSTTYMFTSFDDAVPYMTSTSSFAEEDVSQDAQVEHLAYVNGANEMDAHQLSGHITNTDEKLKQCVASTSDWAGEVQSESQMNNSLDRHQYFQLQKGQYVLKENCDSLISLCIPNEDASEEVYAMISGVNTEEQMREAFKQLTHGRIVFSAPK